MNFADEAETNVTGFDRRGHVILHIDAGGNAFTTIYDGLNRVKVTAGPAISTVSSSGMNPLGPFTYTTNTFAHVITNFYDAAGLALTNVDAKCETNITRMDALGRVTARLTYPTNGILVREQYITYSSDHNSMTATDGSGPNAITHTTYTDNDGQPVLSIAYPSPNASEFTLNQYDASGNLIASQHDSAAGSAITTWTTTSLTFDGLHRVIRKVDRDGAITTYAYDGLGDQTNRTMPGLLQWQAYYNNAGQLFRDQVVNGSSVTRTNGYIYFGSGSPFAGLLQSKKNARGVTCTYNYDNWLRDATNVYTGPLPEQQLTTIIQREPRGYVTNYSEYFASATTGSNTTVIRYYDPYGQLTNESVNGGSMAYANNQTWNATGRRTMLDFIGATANYGYIWRADGALTGVMGVTGYGIYGFDTAGLLTNRIVATRDTLVAARDGEGRPLSIITTLTNSTTLSITTPLTESLSWLGDGLLASDTLERSDFTDNRAYTYANMSRRLVTEQLNLNATTLWTNTMIYDNGVAGGPGVLTFMGQASGASNQWSGTVDAFSRVGTENNNTILSSTYGHVNGQATLTATLDNQPMAITAEGTNAMLWNAQMELTPGQHQLIIAAAHPSGQFTAYATNTFTNSIAYQTTVDTYDGAGNVTNQIWLNPNGTTNRVQTFSWDARGRLHAKTERDANNSGYNWSAIYDAINRRLSITSFAVTNGLVLSTLPNTINSYYDPQVEFLELGVAYGTKMVWKLYGPDADGVYGGENGTGGWDGISPGLGLFDPTLSDVHGNILGMITNGAVMLNSARTTAYGAVPGYRPVPLGNGGSLIQSSAYLGHWPDQDGAYNIGRRPYRPSSGAWETYDPGWNENDPNWYTYCGGDPRNHGDWNGMLATPAVNYGVGVAQGFLQGSTGISTGNPTDTANYNGQLSGRNFSVAVSAWMAAQGPTITDGGLGVMADSVVITAGSGGAAIEVAVPAFVGGAITTAAGAAETGAGLYGIYTFMNLPPLQTPSGDSGGGGSSSEQARPTDGGASVQIAEGSGYQSKSAGGTVYFGGYDPEENTIYLGDNGHANGMVQAGGTPVENVTPGITVTETPTTIIWSADSMSLNKPTLTSQQINQIESGLSSQFPGKTVIKE